MERALRSAKADRSPYEAILFSTLLEDRSLIPALEARARIEVKKRVPHPYAALALSRLKSGNCVPVKKSTDLRSEWKELCLARDSVLSAGGRVR